MEKPIRQPDESSEEFYETMPMAASHYVYRDDALPVEAAPNVRRTAIITLVLVAIVALAVGLLIAKGLDLIRTDMSAPITNNSEL